VVAASTERQGLQSNMKPIKSELKDTKTLEEIGRASIQIVHDLKNQLNGLKLYATFLRKRMEKSERPADEQETVAKLIAGLERAASDMTTLVRYGRPVELRRQPQTDLLKILARIEGVEASEIVTETDALAGELDAAAISEAFIIITSFARGAATQEDSGRLRIHLRPEAGGERAVIEWRGVRPSNGCDPFSSFAGSEGLRMSLAAKIIQTHGGEVAHEANVLRVSLPLQARES